MDGLLYDYIFVKKLNNETCVKGFIYALNGETHKKCRNDGMFFLLTDETAEHIAEWSVQKSLYVNQLHSNRIVSQINSQVDEIKDVTGY